MSITEFEEQPYSGVMADIEMMSMKADIEHQLNKSKNGGNNKPTSSPNRH